MQRRGKVRGQGGRTGRSLTILAWSSIRLVAAADAMRRLRLRATPGVVSAQVRVTAAEEGCGGLQPRLRGRAGGRPHTGRGGPTQLLGVLHCWTCAAAAGPSAPAWLPGRRGPAP